MADAVSRGSAEPQGDGSAPLSRIMLSDGLGIATFDGLSSSGSRLLEGVWERNWEVLETVGRGRVSVVATVGSGVPRTPRGFGAWR